MTVTLTVTGILVWRRVRLGVLWVIMNRISGNFGVTLKEAIVLLYSIKYYVLVLLVVT
jgi:hypothetical protein